MYLEEENNNQFFLTNFNTFNLDKYLNNKSKNRDKRMFVYVSVRNSQMRKGHGICLPYRPLNPS